MPNSFKIIFVITLVLIFSPVLTEASSLGEKADFYVDPGYDLFQREKLSAVLQRIGDSAYFYIDDQWWNDLDQTEKSNVKNSLKILDTEFHYKIYPTLISTFGLERRPGIDKDVRITILIHPINEKVAGYFSSKDEYPKLQVTNSNEREMVYLNSKYITISYVKSLLAHEFVHLISFNQKEEIRGVEEEVWLNEARSEAASTLIGYDDIYEGSYLQNRVKKFLEEPSDSITEWMAKESDYAAVNLFIQYLIDHYGIEVLGDSLKSKEVGIKSLNEALKNRGFKEDFSQIFTDWTIAILANNCSLGEKYCYKNENLKNLHVTPSINFLPLRGSSTLGIAQTAKNWSGNWFKVVGGNGTLKIEFIGNPENLFRVPYLVKDSFGNYSLNFFQLNEDQRGEILISGFGSRINSAIIIPTIQSKMSDFSSPESTVSFFWSASIIKEEKEEENNFSKLLDKPVSEMSKKEILAKISEIEALLNQLKTQLSQLDDPVDNSEPTEVSCQEFNQNLFYGLRNDDRVRCLQEFLKNQGSSIYPEGLVTGNFLSLTRAAVIRFQEKYTEDILVPWELTEGTGYVGSTTRAKINEILGK